VSESSRQSDLNAPAVDRAHWYGRGIRAAFRSVQVGVLFASYVGFGGLIHDVNFPLAAAVLSTALVWALPAQLLLVGAFAAGTAAPVVALAIGLSSVRLLPLVVTILPYLRGRGGRRGLLFLAAHYVAITLWVEGMRQLPALPAEGRRPFYFGLVTVAHGGAVLSTLVGYALAGTLPHALATGLLFLTPISFLLALTRNARDLVDHLSLAFGLALAPLMALYAGTLDLLWTGLVGGTAAFAVHRVLARKRT
jgi:predicted branched-subunit amino acid permease